jgi:hypothetical protein
MKLRTASLTAALIFSSPQAYAAEGKLLLEQLVALAGVEGTKITWGSINEENNSSFTLFDVNVEDKKGEITTIKTVSVRGLRDANGRMTYDSVAFVDVRGKTDSDGDVAIAGIGSSNGDWPSGIWEDGLTAEEKRQRIKFGNFSISGIAVRDKNVKMTLDSIVMTNADIPLDFRFEPDQMEDTVGEPAAPLTFDQFSIVGLNGTGKTDAQQDVDFGMSSFNLSDVNFPTSVDASIYDWMKIYSAMSINGINADMAGEPVFELESISGTIQPPDGTGTIETDSQLTGLYVNLKAIPDPQAQAVFGELGYDKIEGSMGAVAAYNPDTGRATLYDTSIKLIDMFDLYIDYAISGYTAELAQKLSKGQMEMSGGKDPMQVFGPMLAELSTIKLESFGVELEDQSITGRLLDFQAKQMGTTGDQLAAGAPMMIGLGMGGLNMPALTEMVTAAVGKFLTEKGTLSVRAEPAEPVSIVNVVMASQTDPTQIPNLLNLQVTAR